MDKGDIVIASAGGMRGKPRPWVVLQAQQGDNYDTVVICPISGSAPMGPNRIRVQAQPGTGLKKNSVILTEKVGAVRRAAIREKVGSLPRGEARELDYALCRLMALPCI